MEVEHSNEDKANGPHASRVQLRLRYKRTAIRFARSSSHKAICPFGTHWLNRNVVFMTENLSFLVSAE